jgi:hypothetical protein
MIHLLISFSDKEVRGVFTSYDLLVQASKSWLAQCPDETLIYETWEADENHNPFQDWDWVYIAPDSDMDLLKKTEDRVPTKFWWGRLLLGNETSIQYEPRSE